MNEALAQNMENRYMMLHGMRIVEDPNLLVPGESETVQRDWHECLFSLPWRPWRATKIIIPMIPSTQVLRYNNYWIMHPSVATQLKREMQ